MADVNVGTLKATLTVDGKPFEDGLNKATAATKGLDVASANLATGLYNVQTVFGLAKDAVQFYTDATIKAYTEVKQFNNMTGMSVEQGGKWQDMMDKMGMSLSDVTYAFRILSNNIQQAVGDPDSGAGKAFKQLGVTLTDANGKMKDSNTIMLETIAALQKLPSGMEKNALAMDVLGRNYMSMNKLLNDNVSVMERFGDAEAAVTEQGMKNFDKYNEAMNTFNDTLDDLKIATGDEILPLFTTLLGYATQLIDKFGTILGSVEYMGYLIGEIGRGKNPNAPGEVFTREEYFTQKSLMQSAGGKPSVVGGIPTSSGGSSSTTNTKYTPQQKLDAEIQANLQSVVNINQTMKDKLAAGMDYTEDMTEQMRLMNELEQQMAKTTNKELKKLWSDVVNDMKNNPAKGVIDISVYLSTLNQTGNPALGTGRQGSQWNYGNEGSHMYQFLKWAQSAGYQYQEALNLWQNEDMWKGAGFPGYTGEFEGKGMALGGPVLAGSPYIVGERGAELFVPNTSGTIVPNGGVNIFVELDGEMIAQRIAAPLVNEIRVRTGARI